MPKGRAHVDELYPLGGEGWSRMERLRACQCDNTCLPSPGHSFLSTVVVEVSLLSSAALWSQLGYSSAVHECKPDVLLQSWRRADRLLANTQDLALGDLCLPALDGDCEHSFLCSSVVQAS